MSPLVTKFFSAEFAMLIWTLRKKDKIRLTSKEMKFSKEQKGTQFFTKKEYINFGKFESRTS